MKKLTLLALLLGFGAFVGCEAKTEVQEATDKMVQEAGEAADAAGDAAAAAADAAAATVEGAAAEAKAAAADARQMIGRLQGPTTDFAVNGLPQITAAVVQLQATAQSLDRLVSDIQSSPAGALGKAPPEELKVKP